MKLYLEIETLADRLSVSALDEILRSIRAQLYSLVPSGINYFKADTDTNAPRVVFVSITEVDHVTGVAAVADLATKPKEG